MNSATSPAQGHDCPHPQAPALIAYLESSLPARCRFWLSDACANGESVGDVGAELIDALTGRFGWHRDVARQTVNALMEAYGCEQSYGRGRS